ncbi:MAG: hypothetical protein NC133_00030 [Prevotella sp.]|nr:hypothetical protein [Prevotella sp.]
MVTPYEPVKKTYSMKSLPEEVTGAFKVPHLQSKICGNCGYNFDDFVKTGFLGCSECYQYFKKELEPFINEFR